MKHLVLLIVAMWPLAGAAAGETDALLARYRSAVAPCADDAAQDVMAIRHCQGLLDEACMDGEPDGRTTLGMSQCSYAEAAFWDERLNEEWGRVIALVKQADADDRGLEPEYAVREEKLRAAERAWVAFRDAQCAFDYSVFGSGSMRLMLYPDCLSRMTFERLRDLMAIEGDF